MIDEGWEIDTIKCRRCNGYGWVPWRADQMIECPRCQGRGSHE